MSSKVSNKAVCLCTTNEAEYWIDQHLTSVEVTMGYDFLIKPSGEWTFYHGNTITLCITVWTQLRPIPRGGIRDPLYLPKLCARLITLPPGSPDRKQWVFDTVKEAHGWIAYLLYAAKRGRLYSAYTRMAAMEEIPNEDTNQLRDHFTKHALDTPLMETTLLSSVWR